ncbi:MAG: hypothetical protein KDI19_07125 [Pseudomonadales bacterium]|nr:hypothetical protein [Pseudomonadales bacterium]
MKRHFFETLAAAAIFCTANAVYALDALGHIPGYLDALTSAANTMQIRIENAYSIGIPEPVTIEVGEARDYEHTICVASEDASLPMTFTVGDDTHALISRSVALPYLIDIEQDDLTLLPGCGGTQMVTVRVSIDDVDQKWFESQVFTDTVTLSVDPL